MDSGTIKIFHDKLLRLLEQNFRKDSGNKELVLQIYIIIIQKFDMASSSYYEDIADQLLCIDAWADESYEAFPVFSQYLQSWFEVKEVQFSQFQRILGRLIRVKPQVFSELSGYLIVKSQYLVSDVVKLIFEHTADRYFRKSLGQQLMNKEVMVTLGVIAYHHGAKLLNGCCEDIQKGCLEHFLLNQLEVIKQLFGKERKYIFILITQLLFDMRSLSQYGWCMLFQAMLTNIKSIRDVIVDENDTQIEEQVFLSHVDWSFHQKVLDEEKYFILAFSSFFDALSSEQRHDIGSILEEDDQKFLTRLIYEHQ